MTWNYAYTPTIWPSVFTVFLLIALAVYSGRRRSVPGALPFMIGCLFAAAWAAGSVMEVAAADVATKIFWVKFQGAWQLPAATAVTCFILEYAWPGRVGWGTTALTRRNLVLLSIPCLLTLGLMVTNDLHHLIWRGFAYDGKVIPLRGPGNWMLVAYGYGLAVVNIIVFAWLFRRSKQHPWPVVIMLTGLVGGRTIYLLEAAQVLQPALHLDVPPVSFEFLVYAIALFGFRIFDPLPLARQAVIAQMHDGMLVLDPQGRVASLNPSAERILCLPATRAIGKPVKDLLPAYPDEQPDDTGQTEIELSLAEGQELRHYALAISPLKDWRGQEAGRLLLLRDVTAQKRVQFQLLEQQKVVATLQERERLAREMHDSLGQTLAAAHLQASTARLLLAQGETARTDKILEQMADMTIAAETDVREYLLGAKTVFSSDHLFFPALRQYAARFSQQYGLQVELNVPPQLEAQGLGEAVEVQLLRIIQEGLSNVRKHARAKNVQVVFTDSGQKVQIAIIDDGQGFDLAAVVARQANGFGLRAMRERAEALGGCLEVISQPGQGTQVVVQVPVGEMGRLGDTETG